MEYKPDKVTVEVVRDRDSTQTVEDMATAIRIIADQIDEGYTSGSFGDLAWEMEREKEDWEQDGYQQPDTLADIAALTARVSEAETTASPIAATALQEARRHLLHASAAVDRARVEAEGAPPEPLWQQARREEIERINNANDYDPGSIQNYDPDKG